jgi:hypothetical protein
VIEERLNANYVYEIRKGSDKRKFGKLFVNIEYPRLLRPNDGNEIKDFEAWKIWSRTTEPELWVREKGGA